ncbi:NADP-dependent oxidoreductase [uncultured Corynebacterium sp.]|uniref:NADP-dependent oxidoreductase n=1 Tax=uncultured Corynebacterium sp. TaxID=159447 RepID=UPI0025E6F88D|nr:NADP-dependent oxidoreductase [uncultured Corynebacterium sp.]
MNDSANNPKIPAVDIPKSDIMHDVWVATGYNKQLTQKDMPVPQPDPHDVVISVRAASLNPVDQKILDGEMRALMSFDFPLIPGSDGAGVVSQVGSEVTRFKPGDRVFFRSQADRLGALAPFFATHEDTVALAPEGMSFTDAASVPLVGLTAWQALTEKADVEPGDRVLIHAGSGGVGSLAVQMAHHVGAYVIATASGKNADFVRSLGADEVIDYRTQRFEEHVSDLDVVFDPIGGPQLKRSISMVKPGGIVVGISTDPTPQLAKEQGLNPVLRLLFGAISLSTRRMAEKAGVRYEFLLMHPSGDQLAHLAKLCEDGVLKPVVGRTINYVDIPHELENLSGNGVRGKVVVDIKGK